MKTAHYAAQRGDEIIVDLFAGGGGASTGIEMALGRPVDVAVNHNPKAISMHTANHPDTRHHCCDVFEVDPVEATDGHPVGLLWLSPDCRHFSKSKGGKPVSKKVRGLAGVGIQWIKEVRPRVVVLENVEEFQQWGPLLSDGMPCPERKGRTFQRFVARIRNLGYQVEWRELRASDYGVPTIRKRLFLIARRDGLPIVWPKPTHGDPAKLETKAKKLKPWRTAAECIDWSIPTKSIFERERPLADATLRRIAKGVVKYVLEAQKPFIVQYHSAKREGDDRVADIDHPLRTQTTENRFALVTASITKFNTGSVGFPVTEPMHTIVAGGKQARPGTAITQGLLTASLEKVGDDLTIPSMLVNTTGHGGGSADEPLHTITTGGHHALVTAFLAKHYTGVVGSDLNDPLGTVTACDHHSLVNVSLAECGQVKGGHGAQVAAFLLKYYSNGGQDQNCDEPMHTVTTKARMGLVTVEIDGQSYAIVDIGMRMLQPHELFKAQGFPDDYQITHGAAGEPFTKTDQVHLCGNSVCPELAAAIVKANYRHRAALRRAA